MYDLIGVTNETIKSLRGSCSLSDDDTMKLQYIWDSRNKLNTFTIVEVAKGDTNNTQSFKFGVVMNESVVHISQLLNRIGLGSNALETDFVTIPKTGKNGAARLINDLFLAIKPQDNTEDTLSFDAACHYVYLPL